MSDLSSAGSHHQKGERVRLVADPRLRSSSFNESTPHVVSARVNVSNPALAQGRRDLGCHGKNEMYVYGDIVSGIPHDENPRLRLSYFKARQPTTHQPSLHSQPQQLLVSSALSNRNACENSHRKMSVALQSSPVEEGTKCRVKLFDLSLGVESVKWRTSTFTFPSATLWGQIWSSS